MRRPNDQWVGKVDAGDGVWKHDSPPPIAYDNAGLLSFFLPPHRLILTEDESPTKTPSERSSLMPVGLVCLPFPRHLLSWKSM